MKDINKVQIFFGIIILIAFFSVLNKFGLLGKSEKERKEEKEAEELGEIKSIQPGTATGIWKKYKNEIEKKFNKSFEKIPKKTLASLLLNSNDVAEIAHSIKNAHGTFNDDENSIYGAFSKLKSQFNLFQIETQFVNYYGLDLFSYLKSFLDDAELSNVYKIVKKLPVI